MPDVWVLTDEDPTGAKVLGVFSALAGAKGAAPTDDLRGAWRDYDDGSGAVVDHGLFSQYRVERWPLDRAPPPAPGVHLAPDATRRDISRE